MIIPSGGCDAMQAAVSYEMLRRERDALLEIVRKSVEACDYCKNIGAACPCFDMLPPPECDECTLEKSICCKCRAGSHFEFAGVQEGGGG